MTITILLHYFIQFALLKKTLNKQVFKSLNGIILLKSDDIQGMRLHT